MEDLLKDLLVNKRFEYIILRSAFIAVMLVIAADGYYKILLENKSGTLLFTLTLFSCIYFLYLNKYIKWR